MPNSPSRRGTGLCGVATSQFQAVADTTTGTTQGSNSNTLNSTIAGNSCAQQQRERETQRPRPEDPDDREDEREPGCLPERLRCEDGDVVFEADVRALGDQRPIVHRLGRGDDEWIRVDQDEEYDGRDDQRRNRSVASARRSALRPRPGRPEPPTPTPDLARCSRVAAFCEVVMLLLPEWCRNYDVADSSSVCSVSSAVFESVWPPRIVCVNC